MQASSDESLDPKLEATFAAAPLCPVDRLPRRRRNKLCVAIIALGTLNFLIYTLAYAVLGGDAHNGDSRLEQSADGGVRAVYTVRGHFLRDANGREREVSRATWIYSYLHSISVLATSGAMIISMLVLARPHILATMRSGFISGQTFIVAFGTVVILLTTAAIVLFAIDFIDGLTPD